MSRERSIDDLIVDVRQKANMENSEFVTDDEILEALNQQFTKLKTHLRRNEGQPHERKAAPALTVTSAASLYDLPVDFWELLSVEANLGGIQRRLDPYMEAERAALSNASVLVPSGTPMYRLSGQQIEFLPVTQSFSATVYYVPGMVRYKRNQTPRQMVNGWNGYEMAPVYTVVAELLAKEGADPSYWEGKAREMYVLIDANAANRDGGHPERVSEVVPLADEFSYGPWWT